MKYKHLAMIMGVMITATSVGSTATAFAADSKTESTKEAGDTAEDTTNSSDENIDKDSKKETDENEILGEVKSVADGKITIAVGTRKEMEQPGEAPEKPEDGDAKPENGKESDDGTDESADVDETANEAAKDTETKDKTSDTKEDTAENLDKDSVKDNQGAPDGEAPSMLDLTGEEQEITVTDSTIITKQTMDGGQEHLMVILLKNQKKIVEKLLKNQMKIQQTIAPLQNQTIYQQITLIVKKLRRNLMEKLQTNQGQVRARKLH